MIKFENTQVFNFEGAMRGMRNPMNSWYKNDTVDNVIGPNDMELAQRLICAGSEHRKFMRQIFVSVDITAPLYWWKEMDTYKVATVRNSCSTMHKIHVKEFTIDDFSTDAVEQVPEAAACLAHVICTLESLRKQYNATQDKTLWRAIIQLLPDGYNMKATYTCNYENLLGVCSKSQRRSHKLTEWSGSQGFVNWARTLPYAQNLIFLDELE